MAWKEREEGGEWTWAPMKRLLPHDHPLFDAGDEACGLLPKQTVLVDDEEDDTTCRVEEFPCPVVNCQKVFDKIHVFEAHFNSLHRHTCNECRRTFPSPHLLDLHLLESHDAMFGVLAQRQPMYQCLVQGCEERFWTAPNRKDHLVREHKYPANFRFHRNLNDGKKKGGDTSTKEKDGKKVGKGDEKAREVDSMKEGGCGDGNTMDVDGKKKERKERKPKQADGKNTGGGGDENGMEVEMTERKKTPPSDSMESTPTPSQQPPSGGRVFSYKVPDRFTFGHPGERGFMRSRGRSRGRGRGRGRHWHQAVTMETETAVDIEKVNMAELADALEDPGAGGDS